MRFVIGFTVCLLLTSSIFGQKQSSAKLPAPSFNVTSIDGKTFDSEKLKGKIVVLNLWFINCPNCVEEIKRLNEMASEYRDKDVIFIGMATNKKPDLEKFLKKNPFKYNIVPTAMQTILSFGEPDKSGQIDIPFPMHVVIDRDGKIVVRRSGVKGLDDVQSELRRQLKSN